jgi:serine protease Do
LIVLERGMGTGFVVQREKGLLMTNAHVVGRETNVLVIFPRYSASGELLTELRDYGRGAGVKGKVLEVDTRRDLAVIQVTEIPETTKAVAFAPKGAEPGSNVFSVGGSGTKANLLWRLTKGTVRGRSERKVQTQAGVVACTVLETDSPLNPGDSGGPMMNDRGELVAVVSHGDTSLQQISGNIDLIEVQQVLRRHVER